MSKGKVAFIVAILLVFVFLFFFYKPEMGLQHRRATWIKFVNEGQKIDKEPCLVKNYYKAEYSWDVLCKQYPFKAGQVIQSDAKAALRDVGIICEGFKLPTVDKVNNICDYYCKK